MFQKRLNGSVDFYRYWNDYKRGFGDLNSEFWLGLDKIHRLTSYNNNTLRVDLEEGLTNNQCVSELLGLHVKRKVIEHEENIQKKSFNDDVIYTSVLQ